MNSLNTAFYTSCAPSVQRSFIRESEHCVRITNFFSDAQQAGNFCRKLPLWECGPLDTNSKPGAESLLPNWLPRYLLLDYFVKEGLQLSGASQHLTAVCNWLYHGAIKCKEMLSSYAVEGEILPHVDFVPTAEHTAYICLVNLNNHEVSTNFWRFNGRELCHTSTDFEEFQNCIARRSSEYLSLPGEQRREFCASLPELRQSLRVTYQPNEAIIYPAHAYHSPAVEPRHTASNPRLLLRMSYRVQTATIRAAVAAH